MLKISELMASRPVMQNVGLNLGQFDAGVNRPFIETDQYDQC
jgi:hypothetical protein